MQLVQAERDWESLVLLSYTLLNLVIKLRIAALQKTQNGYGWLVVADLLFNSAINEKLFGNGNLTTLVIKLEVYQ